MKKGFTLIEMLVVICLAMMLMAMTATGYQKIKHAQDLSIGGGTVKGALQEARAEALKRNQVVCVYFLDGGSAKNFNDANMDGTEDNPFGDLDKDDVDSYLMSTDMYDIPYEAVVCTRNGEEISRYSLPAGIAWMTMGNAKKTTTNDNPFALEVANTLFGRKCSLAINFAPSGNAWAEVPVNSNGNPYRSEDSYKNIRIFNIDNLKLSSAAPRSDNDGSPEYFCFETDMFKVVEGASPSSTNLTSSNIDKGSRYTNRAKNDVIALNDSITWMVIKMNYATGICDLVNFQDE